MSPPLQSGALHQSGAHEELLALTLGVPAQVADVELGRVRRDAGPDGHGHSGALGQARDELGAEGGEHLVW